MQGETVARGVPDTVAVGAGTKLGGNGNDSYDVFVPQGLVQ